MSESMSETKVQEAGFKQGFRDPDIVADLIAKINPLCDEVANKLGRPVQVMEVCGGHTHAIFHSGINQLLNKSLEFVHGPGCPVCVLPAEAIDRAVVLAQVPEVILATFGDVLRVPGSRYSLQQIKGLGADVRVVYSPFDLLALANTNPDKQVIFLAIGFDTTMPSVAMTIQAAQKQNIPNLKFLCYHIRLMPTLYGLLDKGDVLLDGFIGPGHVSIVLGSDAYQPIADKYQKPLVIAGFEPVDFLQALHLLLLQLQKGRCEIENAYSRVVTKNGNLPGQQAIEEVFAESSIDWRGVGEVAHSVGALKPSFQVFDANTLSWQKPEFADTEPHFCAEVLLGKRKPDHCPLFAKHCQPQQPKGALMVSSEGACAAYYKFRQTLGSKVDEEGVK